MVFLPSWWWPPTPVSKLSLTLIDLLWLLLVPEIAEGAEVYLAQGKVAAKFIGAHYVTISDYSLPCLAPHTLSPKMVQHSYGTTDQSHSENGQTMKKKGGLRINSEKNRFWEGHTHHEEKAQSVYFLWKVPRKPCTRLHTYARLN